MDLEFFEDGDFPVAGKKKRKAASSSSRAAPTTKKPAASNAATSKPVAGKKTSAKVKAKPAKKINVRAKTKSPAKKAPRAKGSALLDELQEFARQQAKIPPENPGGLRATIRLGSDCAGLGSDFVSLSPLLEQIEVKVETRFLSEADMQKRKWLKAICRHVGGDDELSNVKVYKNLCERDNEAAPEVDLFLSGAPCPAYSTQGLNQGLNDDRGAVLLHSLKYVLRRKPPVAIFENVKGLAQRPHKQVLEAMSKMLKEVGYKLYCELVQSCENGLAQSRTRLYLVGIRKDVLAKPFEFPPALQMPNICRFLEARGAKTKMELSESAKDRVESFKIKWRSKGVDVDQSMLVVDLQASGKFANSMVDKSPCLTRARAGSGGFFLANYGRMMTLQEIGALQGWPSDWILKMLDAHNAPVALGHALGDGMSLSVLQRILPRALWCAGMLPRLPKDPWMSIPATGKLPDAVFSRQ